jgi:hypothetical protein
MNDIDGDDAPAMGEISDEPPPGRSPDMLPAPKGLTPSRLGLPA